MILLYTVSYVDKVTEIRGVDQRIGRLDIAARVTQAAICTASDRVGVIVYSASMRRCAFIDYKQRESICGMSEHELIELIASELRQSAQHRDLRELLKEAKKLNYRIVLLSEKGSDFEIHNQRTLYILGAEVDPPEVELRDLIDSVESIGPLTYLASHVVTFLNFMYMMGGKKFGWRPDPSLGGLRSLSDSTASPNAAGLTSGI